MERPSFSPSQGILSPRPEQVLVDAEAPQVLEFLRREMLQGTIRVVPSGRKRLVILPTAHWFGAATASCGADCDNRPR